MTAITMQRIRLDDRPIQKSKLMLKKTDPRLQVRENKLCHCLQAKHKIHGETSEETLYNFLKNYYK